MTCGCAEKKYEDTLKDFREKVEQGLELYLPKLNTRPSHLHEAMRYSMEAGGKRLRPVLLFAASNLYPSDSEALAASIALECIHTYSLIHDDLPAMDNSDLRRGKPTCHKQFDEATAILAGDALLTYAFELISQEYSTTPELALKLIQELSQASGSQKLIGGQMEDILAEESGATEEGLDFIHANKTAALLQASLCMGIHLSSAPEHVLAEARTLGYHLGMAFQIVDDILDLTSDETVLGKTTGLDQQHEKATYPALYGLGASKKAAQKHTQAALEACECLGGNNTFLKLLVSQLLNRAY